MADPTPPPAPQINDGYWFGYSKSLVDSALKSRDDAADKLQTFVAWLWGIYTATAALGINFTKLNLDPWSTALICSPVGTLIVVYWLTVWVRMPALLEFDPRSPDEIEAVYEHNLKEKQRRLSWALAMAGIAAGLVIAGFLRSATVMSPAPRVQVEAGFSVEGAATNVSFRGYIAGGTSGTLTLYPIPRKDDTPLRVENLQIVEGHFRLPPKSIEASVTKLRVQISADLDSDTHMTVMRDIAVPTLAPISSAASQ